MNKTNIKFLSLFLAIMMIACVLISCKKAAVSTGVNTSTEGTTSRVEDSSDTEQQGKDTDGEKATNGTESGNGSGNVTEPTETADDNYIEVTEETYASILEGENSALIEYADYIANGVNAYFTDPTRTAFYFENKYVDVTCDLSDSKMVSSITNKHGGTYVENTMDVFLRMSDGTTLYASDSMDDAIANIYKMGYYYYENRIEGLTFTDGYVFVDNKPKKINHTNSNIIRYNSIEYVGVDAENGGITLKVTDNRDPWIAFGNVNFSSSDYNVLAVTMKADGSFTTGLDTHIVVGDSTGSATNFDNIHRIRIDIIPDGEYHTYYVPLYQISGYLGQVTGLRFDWVPVSGALNPTVTISEVALRQADLDATPGVGVYFNRVFNTYSDKLHQTIQISTRDTVENVKEIGLRTEIPADKVAKLIIKDIRGLHYSLDDKISNRYTEYVGFDIKGAGIFGFIMPGDKKGGVIEVKLDTDRNVYVIEQTFTPDGYKLIPSVAGTQNANDVYFGSRIYTDTTHSFDKFIKEAELEVNPLGEENFIVTNDGVSVGEFIEYDSLRGSYYFTTIGEEGFTRPYSYYPNRHFNLTFAVKGDGENDRKVYIYAKAEGAGALQCAALLDENQMMLPIPLEVGKNYSDGNNSIFDLDDPRYGETILPLVINKDTDTTYSILNLYQNWGKYHLKQISYIVYYAPYYHMSTGIHESNCLTPYYFTNQPKDIMQVLPDHRPMSGPLIERTIQHTYAGVHSFMEYTDADGNYCASENIKNTIGSYGPVYFDVTMDYISDDGKIKISYNHMEFPQTDENRAYYEIKYEVLDDVSFADFGRDFSFYSVRSYDPAGLYTKVGYLGEDNASKVTDAAKSGERYEYVLGKDHPYFSYFDMENCTHPEGYNNLSFMIYQSSFIIGGEKVEPSFLLVNEHAKLSLSLDLGEIVLKKGDSITIYAIIMPWQWYEEYDEIAPDINVRTVRENSILNPLTVTAGENSTVIDSPFLPKIKSNDGKSATFTLSGGHNNVAVRVYGFNKLTAPKIEELIDGEWVPVDISSFSTPDNFGYGYYYDGYSVHYEGDGTFSYSFVTTMDNGAPRTFRVSETEDFAGWPKVEEEIPMNLWLDNQKLNAAFTTGANRFGEYMMMSEGGVKFLRVNRNGTDNEATITILDDENGVLAGRYLVYKFRVPQGEAAKLSTWEFYTGTEHTMYDEKGNILIAGEEYKAVCPGLSNGEWNVVIIDLEAYGKTNTFKKADDGNYYVKYLRWDVFNKGLATDAIIDISYIGFHDSLDEIVEYNKDIEGAMLCYKSTTLYDDLSPKAEETEKPMNYWADHNSLNDIFTASGNRFGGVSIMNEGGVDFLRINRNGSDNEATITLFDSAAGALGGRYLVFKFRAPGGEDSQVGTWEFFTGTEHTMYDQNGNILIAGEDYRANCSKLTDGEWHVVIIDLEAYNKTETFKKDAEGNYYVKYLRWDVFNSGGVPDAVIDIAYIALHDSMEEILAYNSADVAYVTCFSGVSNSLSVSTKSSEGLNLYMSASDLYAKVEKYQERFHSVTLSSDASYVTLAGCVDKEARIDMFKGNVTETGQYFVIKYRIPEDDPQLFASWQFYTNTDGASASDSNVYNCSGAGSQVIADGEWQVLIVDLAAWGYEGFAPDEDGKYTVNYFRFDFFNKTLDADKYYDIEYMAFADSLDKIYEYNKELDKVVLSQGDTESVFVDPKTGETIVSE